VFVRDAPPQDEGLVIELVILSIQEEHLADLRLQTLEALSGEIDIGVLRGSLYDLGEFIKALDRGKAVTLQDDLAFKVLHVIEWMAIAVGSLFEIGNPFGLSLFVRILRLVFFSYSLVWAGLKGLVQRQVRRASSELSRTLKKALPFAKRTFFLAKFQR